MASNQNDRFLFVSSMLDYNLKVTIKDLIGLDRIDLQFLISNYAGQMAELIKHGATSYKLIDNDMDYCNVCGEEIGYGGIYYRNFVICARCY